MKNRLHLGLAGTLFAGLLTACSLPSPTVHEILEISADGHYHLQGVAVARDELQSVLLQEQDKVKTLLLEIRPTPETDMALIRFAVQAAKSAHARVAFTSPQAARHSMRKGDEGLD